MFSFTVLGVQLYFIVWGFFLFSFLGVFVEMIFCYSQEGIIESRLGVLYLPLSPIYGLGGVSLSLFLYPWFQTPILMFFFGMIVGSVLEYVASFVMEKAFHAVFWDYSDKPLNLHGRVCLQYSVYWGLLSLLLLYVIDRWAFAFVALFDRSTGEVIMSVALLLFTLAVILTLAAFTRVRHKLEIIQGTRADHVNAFDRVIDTLVPDTVLINTFPRMSIVVDYMQATGQHRKIIRADLHLGRPSALRQRLQEIRSAQ